MLPHRRCRLRNHDNTAFAGGVPVSGEHTDGGRGWLGRVGGGCDYQFWQRFVVGALADYDFASLKGDLAALGPFNVSGQEKMNWAWAAGGRLGYLPWDTLMVYVSGGYTQAHFNVRPHCLHCLYYFRHYRLISGQRLRIQVRLAAWFVLENRISFQQLQQKRHPTFKFWRGHWRLYSFREVRPNSHLVAGLALQLVALI
jgi:hypothetical protein